jgi:gliding motility-associated-like protein
MGNAIVTNVSCYNAGDGSININPINGGNGGPFMVTWQGSSLSGPIISSLAPGTYTPIIKDANGCTHTFNPITVTGPGPLTQSASITDQQSPSQLGSVILTVTGGTAPYSYTWNTGATSKDLTSLVKNSYTVTVTDSHGCSTSQTWTVNYPNVIPNWWGQVTKTCDNNCIILHIPAGAPGPYLIKWSGQVIGQLATPDTVVNLCHLAGGTYDFIISDNGGNTAPSKSITIVPLEQATVSNSTVVNSNANQKTGVIVLAPSNPNDTYLWNFMGKTTSSLVGLDSGTYIVTVTAPSGCSAVYSYHVVRQYPILVSDPGAPQNPMCLTSKNGAITLPAVTGGNPPYKFIWSNGATTQNLTGLGGGSYTVTISDQNDTLRIQSFTLTPQSALAVTGATISTNYNGYQVSGANSCDGAAAVAFTGQNGTPTIQWSNGVQGAAQNTTLCAGAYTVTVTDFNGCSSTWTGSLTAPKAILIDAKIDSTITCHGKCNGKASAVISGGVAPYTVYWSNGNIDNLAVAGGISKIVNLCGGTYSVTVTDANHISQVLPVVVTDPDPITLTLDIQQIPQSFNSCDGAIQASAPGAVLPATYTWYSSQHHGTTNQAEQLCAQEQVTFTIVDAAGCSAKDTITVPFPKSECLQVRPVITPGQQDGKNDFLFIPCIEQVKNSIEIYNRWGQLVFQTTNYDNASNNWTGLTKTGQPLAAGVYYYVLTFTDDQGNQQQLKGYVNLLL